VEITYCVSTEDTLEPQHNSKIHKLRIQTDNWDLTGVCESLRVYMYYFSTTLRTTYTQCKMTFVASKVKRHLSLLK